MLTSTPVPSLLERQKVEKTVWWLKAEGYNGYRKAGIKKASAYKTTATGTSNTSANKSVDELAKEVIQGKWSAGDERKQKLTAAGYDYGKVQTRVNELMKNQ